MEKDTTPVAGLLGIQIDPLRLAAILFGAAVFGMTAAKIAEKMGAATMGGTTAWTIGLAFLLMFSVGSAIFSISAPSETRYFARSVYSFLGLAVANGLCAWQFSGLAVSEAGSYKKLHIVVAVGFLVFISMVSAMKKIVAFAEREDWQQPRTRR